MSTATSIEWTDATWNPWQGCHKVSPGCKHCYMYREKKRYGQNPAIVIRSKPHTFNMPLRLKGSARVFTCSWSDFFIEEADEWRADAWEIIARTPQLTYQILTKRPERTRDHLPYQWALWQQPPWPNVWLGVSVEDQATADERIPLLLKTPAAVRWVSYEPALAGIDRWKTVLPNGDTINWLTGMVRPNAPLSHDPPYPGPRLNWIVVGGESGPGARPFDLAWARQTITQGRAAGVPVFVKQLGAKITGTWHDDATQPHGLGIAETIVHDGIQRVRWSLKDRKGGDPAEWPKDLRVREYPACATRAS